MTTDHGMFNIFLISFLICGVCHAQDDPTNTMPTEVSTDPISLPDNTLPTSTGIITATNSNTGPSSESIPTCYYKNEEPVNYRSPCIRNKCEQVNLPVFVCRFLAIRVPPYCDCVDSWRRSDGFCVNKDQCQFNTKLKNPKCYGKHLKFFDRLMPREYRDCRNFLRSSASSSSTCSSSSSSSTSASSSWNSFRYSPLAEFTYLHRYSEKVILNVCNCKIGYYLNAGGFCVRKEHCFKHSWFIRCPGLNEKWKRGRCVCEYGYDRNECGQCVSWFEKEHTANCLCTDPCPGKHTIRHIFADDNQNTCENYLNRKNNVSPDPSETSVKRLGCDCIKGFYSNSSGICVNDKECE